MKRIAVVVPVHNRKALTQRFLESMASVKYSAFHIVIVDDGSTDNTATWLATDHPQVTVLMGTGDLWWTGATNLGVEYALLEGFDYVLTINNDAIVDSEFLSRLVESATQNSRSIIGCCLYDSNDPQAIWSLGGIVDWRSGQPFQIRKPHTIGEARLVVADILPGCGVLVPTDCFREIGFYNDRWYPQYHSDSEFILRASRAGYHIYVDTQAQVWYDTNHGFHPRSLWSSLMSKRSPAFWKPVLNIHWQYCPWRWMLPSLLKFYLYQNRLFARRATCT